MNKMSVKPYYILPALEVISVGVVHNILSNPSESTIGNYDFYDLPEE